MDYDLFALRREILSERISARDSWYTIANLPSSGQERIEALEEWMDAECTAITSRTPPELQTVWLEGAFAAPDERCYPLQVQVPIVSDREANRFGREDPTWKIIRERRSARESRGEYFTEWNECGSPIEPRDVPDLAKRLLERINRDLTTGSVTISPEEITITLGQRRPTRISSSDTGKLIFLEERKDRPDLWVRTEVRPSLFRDVVAPTVGEAPFQDPFDWAAQRLSIVHGFAQTLMGKDLALVAAEIPYQEVARRAANLHPPRLDSPIHFERNEELDARLALLNADPLPEACYLMLSIDRSVPLEVLGGTEFRRFVQRLPHYLENGLCIDRVIELVRSFDEHKGSEYSYLTDSLAIVDALYGASERPWWFHEDQRILPTSFSSTWGDAESRKAHVVLAVASGATYQYAKEVWERSGAALIEESGLSLATAVDLVATVSRNYGIGNIDRAINVLEFAKATLAEAPPRERHATCRELQDLFVQRKPSTEMIGFLEGSNISFEMPGLSGFASMFGIDSDDSEERHLFALNFTPALVQEAVAVAGMPLEERALKSPTLAIEHQPRHQFITKAQEARSLALRGPTLRPTPINRPLHTWIDFDRQLRREVPAYAQTAVAARYLQLLANKFPNPFSPPEGFLTLVYRLDQIYDPENQPEFMFAPDEREAQRAKNAAAFFDRWALLASWLDTAVLGLQTYEGVIDTFLWVLLDRGNSHNDPTFLSPDRQHIQVDRLWERYWQDRDTSDYSKQHSWSELDAELRSEQKNLETLEGLCLRELQQGRPHYFAKDVLSWTRSHLRNTEQRRSHLKDGRDVRESYDYEEKWGRIDRRITFLIHVEFFVEHLDEHHFLATHERRLIPWIQSKVADARNQMELLYERDLWADHRSRREDDSRTDEIEQETEEQRQAEEQERHDEHWRREVDEGIRQEILTRFRRLGSTMELFTCVNGLVASGVISREIFPPIIQLCVTGLMDGSLAVDTNARHVLEDIPRAIEVLDEMRKHGVAEVTELEAGLKEMSKPQQVVHALLSLVQLVRPYEEAKEYLASEMRVAVRDTSSSEYYQNRQLIVADRVRDILHAGSVHFAPNAAQIMMDHFFWIERYRIITKHIDHFLGALPGVERAGLNDQFEEADIEPTLRRGLILTSTVYLFAVASKIMREEGLNPFEVRGPAVPPDPSIQDGSDQSNRGDASSLVVTPRPILPSDSQGNSLSPRPIVPVFQTRNLPREFKDFQERVIECRRKDFGKLALGGKVHIIHDIDAFRLQFLKDKLGLRGTTFKVDNAKHLVCLPATASAREIQLIAEFLNIEGIINPKYPEIQICGAGRLTRENCAILGPLVMACSNVNVPYDEEAFKIPKDRSKVGHRILIYDAEGVRNKFPFDVTRRGRTDILGRRTLSDFPLFQSVHTVLSYGEEPLDKRNTTISTEHLEAFHYLADELRLGFRGILERYGLSGVLDQLWLHPEYLPIDEKERYPRDEEEGSRFFHGAVKPIMDAWDECADAAEVSGSWGGFIGESRNLLEKIESRVRLIQADMLESPLYTSHRETLFKLDYVTVRRGTR